MTETLDFRDPDWVAEQLNIDKNAVYRYLSDGTLPGLQLGRKWLISESSLVAHLKAEERRQTESRRQSALNYDRFSQRAYRVLVTAQKEALARNHTYIGQEHLTLAIALVPESAGLVVLDRLGVSAERLRDEVGLVMSGPNPTQPSDEIGLTSRARRALELAAEESRALGNDYVGVEHILLGLLREGGGLGHGVLTGLGVTVENARAELKRFQDDQRMGTQGASPQADAIAPEGRSGAHDLTVGPAAGAADER